MQRTSNVYVDDVVGNCVAAYIRQDEISRKQIFKRQCKLKNLLYFHIRFWICIMEKLAKIKDYSERGKMQGKEGKKCGVGMTTMATGNNHFSVHGIHMIFHKKCNKSRSRHVESHGKGFALACTHTRAYTQSKTHTHISSFSYSLAIVWHAFVAFIRLDLNISYDEMFIVCIACHLSLLPETVYQQREKNLPCIKIPHWKSIKRLPFKWNFVVLIFLHIFFA